MRKPGLTWRQVAVCAIAAVLAGTGSWAIAQQPAPATPAAGTPQGPASRPDQRKMLQKAPDKPRWKDLTRAQQVALAPLAGEWDQMDGVRKKKWLEMANRFASMKPEEQQRVQERMREWVRLTPAQRKLARDTYTRTRKLAPGEKTATWESYQQLPEEQKKKLAAAAAARKPAPRPGTAARRAAAACPAGTVKNPASESPPCVAAPATPATPAAPAVTAPPPTNTPPATATPASNAQ